MIGSWQLLAPCVKRTIHFLELFTEATKAIKPSAIQRSTTMRHTAGKLPPLPGRQANHQLGQALYQHLPKRQFSANGRNPLIPSEASLAGGFIAARWREQRWGNCKIFFLSQGWVRERFNYNRSFITGYFYGGSAILTLPSCQRNIR